MQDLPEVGHLKAEAQLVELLLSAARLELDGLAARFAIVVMGAVAVPDDGRFQAKRLVEDAGCVQVSAAQRDEGQNSGHIPPNAKINRLTDGRRFTPIRGGRAIGVLSSHVSQRRGKNSLDRGVMSDVWAAGPPIALPGSRVAAAATCLSA